MSNVSERSQSRGPPNSFQGSQPSHSVHQQTEVAQLSWRQKIHTWVTTEQTPPQILKNSSQPPANLCLKRLISLSNDPFSAESKNKTCSWSDLEAFTCKNTWAFKVGINICCPNLDNWCSDWNPHSKHNLHSLDFSSTFISCQQTALIHPGKLHHQSSPLCTGGLVNFVQ